MTSPESASPRSLSAVRDIGTSAWPSTETISATTSPKASTGRASRHGESPLVCATTSSLSAASRLSP